MTHHLLAASLPFNIGDTAVNQGLPGASSAALNDPNGGLGTFIGGLLSAIMVVAALMVLLYLLWGGIEWITSGGDKGKIEKARSRMTGAMIGIIVLAAVLAIFGVLQAFLGITIFTFS